MRKYSENHVEHFDVNDDGIDIVLHHILPRSDLPEIAQTVMKKDMVITRKESYSPSASATTGTYEASIPAGPGSLTGTMKLFGHRDGLHVAHLVRGQGVSAVRRREARELMLVNLSTCSAPKPRSPQRGSSQH